MSIPAIGSFSSAPSQVQSLRASDQDVDDVASATAAGTAASTAPAKPNDGDADDAGAASTALTRSSAAVQQALTNLKVGG
jgi:hypothetical protein